MSRQRGGIGFDMDDLPGVAAPDEFWRCPICEAELTPHSTPIERMRTRYADEEAWVGHLFEHDKSDLIRIIREHEEPR